MNSFSKAPSRIIAIFLIVVVGMHSLNSFFYTHSHQLDDGTVITHAHPFDTSSDTDPFKSHEHTAAELTFLASLIYFLPAFLFAIVGVTLLRTINFSGLLNPFFGQLSFKSPPLRGPPAFL